MYVEAQLDRETSERAGAGGMFQVAALTDEDGNDITDIVDVGKHYSSIDQLARDIARSQGINVDDVDINEA